MDDFGNDLYDLFQSDYNDPKHCECYDAFVEFQMDGILADDYFRRA